MKRLLSLSLILISLSIFFTQSGFSQTVEYSKEAVLEFDQSDFGEKFCVMAQTGSDADFYVIDQTKLPGEFGRIYFLNLVYQDNKVVNIDPDITSQQMWFKASISFTNEEIICLLDEMKAKTDEADTSFTTAQKEEWLAKHNKFNKK